MTKSVERYPLAHVSPGTRREVLVHRYGQDSGGNKAYLQASIHADETPALLTLHHLLRLLDRADRDGAITGEIVIVPYANPIGLDQFVNAGHTGRYELAGGGNFNRNWPDLSEGLVVHTQKTNRTCGLAFARADARALGSQSRKRKAIAATCLLNESGHAQS